MAQIPKYELLPVPTDTGPESWDCEGCGCRPSVGTMSLPDGPAIRVCLVCLPDTSTVDFECHVPWCTRCCMFHAGPECE